MKAVYEGLLVPFDTALKIELRYFVGLGIPEIAAVSNASESTIKRRWQTARLWLASELRAA